MNNLGNLGWLSHKLELSLSRVSWYIIILFIISDIRFQMPVEGRVSILSHAIDGILLLGIHWVFCLHNAINDDAIPLFLPTLWVFLVSQIARDHSSSVLLRPIRMMHVCIWLFHPIGIHKGREPIIQFSEWRYSKLVYKVYI